MTTRRTGRSRLRLQKRWFRRALLVLQVEFEISGTNIDPYFHDSGNPYQYKDWRDARLEDLTVLKGLQKDD